MPAFSRAAVSALLAGCLVGVATAGVIPGLESWHQGICSIQGWACAIAVYTFMRGREIRERSYIKVDSDKKCRRTGPAIDKIKQRISGQTRSPKWKSALFFPIPTGKCIFIAGGQSEARFQQALSCHSWLDDARALF
ncbi:MAG: hypothetical protein R3D26_21865 [Cyanobacteriota/Melainabacteria group bacterium]